MHFKCRHTAHIHTKLFKTCIAYISTIIIILLNKILQINIILFSTIVEWESDINNRSHTWHNNRV